MRSLPSVLRSIAGWPLGSAEPAPQARSAGPDRALARALVAPAQGRMWSSERPSPQLGNDPVARASLGLAAPDPAELRDLERMDALLRRYQGRPPRIENPFAAFPTRSYWLGRLMNDPHS